MEHAISCAAGKLNTQAKRVALTETDRLVEALKQAIESIPPQPEAWWSGHCWDGGRSIEHWTQSSAIVLDVDYYDQDGNHTETTEAAALAFADVAANGDLPGNLYHGTPRGVRLVFLLQRPEQDPQKVDRAAAGAVELAENAIREHQLEGYHVDRSATDRARLYYAPRSVVDGIQRNAPVMVLRREPYDIDELVQHAPPEPELDLGRIPPRPGEASTELEQATAKWNEEHRQDWTATNKTCPMCGHNGCFVPLPQDPTRWFCWSDNHGKDSGGAGIQTPRGWMGDALDLEAHRRNQSRIDVLRADGYLEKPKPALKKTTVVPEIITGPDLHRQVVQAEAALVGSPTNEFYQRGGIVTQMVRDGARKIQGLTRVPHAPTIQPTTHAYLKVVLSREARWMKLDKKAKSDNLVPTVPPDPVVRALLDKAEWTLPYLESVVEIPVLRPDGTVLVEPGYDGQTGIYLDPGNRPFPKVPEHPDRERAKAAYEYLLHYFCDFGFGDDSSKAATVAAILTALARPAISGPTPMFAIRAPVRGAGKGLLATCIALIGTGRRPPVIAPPTDNESTNKLLLTIALEGQRVILIDNIEGAFGSPVLAAGLTANEYQGRVLGQTRSAKAPLRPLWICTGNNIGFRGDMARRVIPIDIDPRCENPEDRDDFQHDLPADIEKDQPNLVVAGLTILRAHRVAGSPGHGQPRLGSFESWDDAVRAPLMWAVGVDPCEGRRQLQEDADLDLERIRHAYAVLSDAYGTGGWTVSDAIQKAGETDGEGTPINPELKSLLTSLDYKSDGNTMDARRIGHRIRLWQRRIVDGKELVRDDTRKRAIVWAIRPPQRRSG